MKGYLLDVNTLIALLWARHEHHDAVLRWFGRNSKKGWATCTLTQLGFVRIVTNAAFSPQAVRPAEALSLLKKNFEHPNHSEWPDRSGAVKLLEPFRKHLIGHRQITDAYLVALAAKHNGKLATLDHGIESVLPPGSFSDLLELVPTRSSPATPG